MFRIFIFIMIFTQVSCSINNRSRRPVATSEIVFSGGSFEDKQWNDKLRFTRVSWFRSATLSNEVMFATLEKDSPFVSWLGSDKDQFNQCFDFKIAIIYSHSDSKEGNSYMFEEIKKSGYEYVNLLDFSHYLAAHQNYLDWKLSRHKIVGFCHKTSNSQDIEISLPGFTKKIIKI